MTVHLRYFAALADQAGVASETVETHAISLAGLYDEVRARRGLRLERAWVRVAVQDEFADWNRAPRDGDRIAFMPPVSGG
ncbi:ThiS family protein [mine drainage metagenome]|uniref:ThiS family protein n=1 Tax=mine drainage metagenome TaxID=410659 RepID=A0A1J5R9P3_9ZZZZ